jgi:hypothetical protein
VAIVKTLTGVELVSFAKRINHCLWETQKLMPKTLCSFANFNLYPFTARKEEKKNGRKGEREGGRGGGKKSRQERKGN